MEKKKITYKKLLEFNNSIGIIDTNKKDRLSLCTVNFINKMKYHFEQYHKASNKIDQDLCSIDSDGNFFLDPKGNPIYTKFNKENQKKRDDRIDLLLKEEIEIEPCICTDLNRVQLLHLSIIKLFNGFLFDISNEKLEEWFSEGEEVSVTKNV